MQDIAAIMIVAVAAAYLARRTWLRVVHGNRDACGLCSGCTPAQSIKQRPLVPLDQPPSSAASVGDEANK